MELFPRESESPAEPDAPLAERMRPRRLEDFVGQQHLLGSGRPLEPVVAGSGSLASLIFWGPPGSGKTTLARLLALKAGLHFVSLSAVMSGVRDLREAIAEAERDLRRNVRTALFIDEIHRFNKAQQDALLPFVERGTVVFLGATTENPSFEVISALRSRTRVFTLRALEEEELGEVVDRALSDSERGLGARELRFEPEARALLVRLAAGDARRALTLVERAAERSQGTIARAAVEGAVEARLPDYDKDGDAHYDVISAFIKSLRGSDPDASVYWLSRMLEAGEDPRFITRRIVIFASEDVGNADPRALAVAVAAAEAFDRVGLPEGRLILSQAVTYLASAPKSNASLTAIVKATEDVREYGALPVPLHLRNAPTELMRKEGYGKGYRYPHDTDDHFVKEQYLPERIARAVYYRPSDQGDEVGIGARLRAWWGDDKEPESWVPFSKSSKSPKGPGSSDPDSP